MKPKFCLRCGCDLNSHGSPQSHRQMYCGPSCKAAMGKLIARRRKAGLPMPWEEPDWYPGKDLRKSANDIPRERPEDDTVVRICQNPACGKPFEVPNDNRAPYRRYCCRECEAEARRKRQLAAWYAKRRTETVKQSGSWGLETDPWATGQLPAEVRANALWA